MGYSLEDYASGCDVIAFGRGFVCSMPSLADLKALHRSVEESEANGRLIADAPRLARMAAAGEELVKALGRDVTTFVCDTQEQKDRLFAAITAFELATRSTKEASRE